MTDRFLEILFNPLHRALKWYDDTIGFACTRRAALWYSASVTIAAVIIALAPNPDLNAEAFWLTGMAPIIFALGGLLFFNLCVLVPVVGIASVFY